MEYEDRFIEFCRLEKASGGPDPQLPILAYLSRGETLQERLWRAFCYAAYHSVPSAERTWMLLRWDPERPYYEYEKFAREEWEYLAFRTERRCIRAPYKLARFLNECASWVNGVEDSPWWIGSEDYSLTEAYELAWKDILRVWNLGRYIALKVLEYFEVYEHAPIMLVGIRARGGWSPRRALSALAPEHAELLNGNDDSPENVAKVEAVAAEVYERVRARGLDIRWYEFQVMLCEFRENYESKRYYPGRSHDEELKLWRKTDLLDKSQMFGARKVLFPHVHLGELNSWAAPRPLGHVLSDYGYQWADTLYDYDSTFDFREPVAWSGR